MKNENIDTNNLPEFPATITKENKHLFPKNFQEVLEFVEKNKGEILFKERYFESQKKLLIGTGQ